MTLRKLGAARAMLLAGLAAASWGQAQAQAPAHDRLYVRSLAATCANCHGTEGRTVQGSAVPSIAGMPKEYMVRQLRAFRDGSRPATVMHQITKGFTEPQLDAIATYFAALPK